MVSLTTVTPAAHWDTICWEGEEFCSSIWITFDWISHNPTRSGENFRSQSNTCHNIDQDGIHFCLLMQDGDLKLAWPYMFTAAWEQLMVGLSGALGRKNYTLKCSIARSWMTAAWLHHCGSFCWISAARSSLIIDESLHSSPAHLSHFNKFNISKTLSKKDSYLGIFDSWFDWLGNVY